jgi:hypothetical protein
MKQIYKNNKSNKTKIVHCKIDFYILFYLRQGGDSELLTARKDLYILFYTFQREDSENLTVGFY